jgi:membrane protein
LRARLATAMARVHRVGWLDHVVRAGIRYDDADGGRLAAAITYYAFFAVFSLALLGFALIGFIVPDATLASLQEHLPGTLPRPDAAALRDVRGVAGLIGFVVWPVSGVFWVDALRSSMRAMWRLPQYPGRFWQRQLINLAMLAGIGLLLTVSLTVAVGAKSLSGWLVIAPAGNAAAGLLLGVAMNTGLSAAVLAGLPRLRIPLRRVLGPALLVAGGVQLLTSIGRLYVNATEANPAYRLVAGAVGLLVFLNILNQLILFATALTATGGTGTVIDLAARQNPKPGPPETRPIARSAVAGPPIPPC